MLLAGQKLGPYEILSPLGRGGMGEVWRARDSRLGRLIFDCFANHSPSACRRVLNSTGLYVGVGAPANGGGIAILTRLIQMLVFSLLTSHKVVTFLARPSKDDLIILCELMATGKITPVIDRRYRLSEVPEANRYLEERHGRGKVVITLE
jgi:NADPH:quinone reductase-like Zn-dependent oxidoreductase